MRTPRLILTTALMLGAMHGLARAVPPATFAAKADFTTGAGPASVAIGDVSGDGKPDMISANSDANTVSVLLGEGASALRAAPGCRTGVA